MSEYVLVTVEGEWRFCTENDKEAMRQALNYCVENNEKFLWLEGKHEGIDYNLNIVKISKYRAYTI